MQRKKNEKRKRRAYTAADLAELWDRWGRGESSKRIARVMDRGASVYTVLLRHGGIRPRVRCGAPQALTLAEREGDLARHRRRQVTALHRPGVNTCSIDREPGDSPQRRFGSLPGLRGGRAGLGASAAPEAVPVGTLSPATPTGGAEAAAGLGSATDRRLAEAYLSWR